MLSGHNAAITGCAFNNDESQLVTCARDGEVSIWEIKKLAVDDGTKVNATPTRTIHCHSDWINGIAWSDTSDFFVSIICNEAF